MNAPALVIAIALEEHVLPFRIDDPGAITLRDVAGGELRLSAWLRNPIARRRVLREIEAILDRIAEWEHVDQELAA